MKRRNSLARSPNTLCCCRSSRRCIVIVVMCGCVTNTSVHVFARTPPDPSDAPSRVLCPSAHARTSNLHIALSSISSGMIQLGRRNILCCRCRGCVCGGKRKANMQTRNYGEPGARRSAAPPFSPALRISKSTHSFGSRNALPSVMPSVCSWAHSLCSSFRSCAGSIAQQSDGAHAHIFLTQSEWQTSAERGERGWARAGTLNCWN